MGMFTLIPLNVFMNGPIYENDTSIRNRAESGGGMTLINQPLASDATGSMALSLTNVVPGSSYDIEVAGTRVPVIAPGVAEGTTLNLSVPVYLAGDPKNTLRIKVRKASASPYYQPYETQVTAAVGAQQSIFINQLLDE